MPACLKNNSQKGYILKRITVVFFFDFFWKLFLNKNKSELFYRYDIRLFKCRVSRTLNLRERYFCCLIRNCWMVFDSKLYSKSFVFVTGPLRYRYSTVALPLRYRYVIVTAPLRYRYVTVTKLAQQGYVIYRYRYRFRYNNRYRYRYNNCYRYCFDHQTSFLLYDF